MTINDGRFYMVDIIIVNYNAGPLLADCAQAALQSTIPVNIFISDNGSTDNSLALLKKNIIDQRLHIIENNENLGFSKGNNQALPLTNSDYLLFLNPDCIIQADTLEKLIAQMQKNPQVGMAGCLIQNPDGTEQAGCRRNIPNPWTAFIRAFGLKKLAKIAPNVFKPELFNDFVQNDQPLPKEPVIVEAISGAFMLVTREALNKVGHWDEGYFLHCEDLDWCMRFNQAGYKILFVPKVAVMHVKGACSQTRPAFVQYHMHKGMVRFYKKFFSQRYPKILMYAVFIAIWLRFSLLVIRDYCKNKLAIINRSFSAKIY